MRDSAEVRVWLACHIRNSTSRTGWDYYPASNIQPAQAYQKLTLHYFLYWKLDSSLSPTTNG